MRITLAKGAILQGPFGDIGRHGDYKNIFLQILKGSYAGSQWDYTGDTGRHRDLKTISCINLIEGAMQGPVTLFGWYR